MPKAIRPTLTPAELAIVDASAAEMVRFNQRARQLAEACRAHGWYTIASLAGYQPNETIGSDYGPWLYEHHVYATAYDDSTYIGTIAYKDGECPNLYGVDDGALLYPVLLGDKNEHLWQI